MRLPKEKIIFVVDILPVGTVPGRVLIDFYPLEAADWIEKIIAIDWDRMIPGHPGQPNGRLGSKKDAQDILDFAAGSVVRGEEDGPGRQVLGAGGKGLQAAEIPKLARLRTGAPLDRPALCALWGRGT